MANEKQLNTTIFCNCEDNYYKIKQRFDCKLNTIKSILLNDEFTKEKNNEKIIYQSDICYIIIDLWQDNDLKRAKCIYEIAKKKDIQTIGIGIKPSFFRNDEDEEIFNSHILWIKDNLDCLVVIDDQAFISNGSKSCNKMIDTLESMIYIISVEGLVNMDMTQFKSIISGNTIAYPAFGRGSGVNRASLAAEQAIQSEFLIHPLDQSTKQLLYIEGDSSMDLLEIKQICDEVKEASNCNSNIIFGASFNDSLKDEIKLSIISAGYSY